MDYSTALQNDILITRAENESAQAVNCSEKSDYQLVDLILAGNETAFEQIYERYKRLVASIAGRYFRQPEQIEDIIQISFTKIYFELKDFRGKHDFSLASWIGKIATNSCLDALRSQKRKSEDLLSELTESENESLQAKFTSPNNAETAIVDSDLAEKLLARLSIEDRAILQMIDAEELSVNEVAEITGWSKSKIKVRAYRARHTLRKILRKFL